MEINEINKETKLMQKIVKEMQAKIPTKIFGKTVLRSGLIAYQGLGRAFIDPKIDIKEAKKKLKAILDEYYEIYECVEKINGDFIALYFIYDSSRDGDELIFQS